MTFKKLTWYQRVGTKISVPISVLIIIAMSAYIYFTIREHRGQLTEEVIRSAGLLSDTIKLSTREDMLRYSPARLHQSVDNIGAQQSIEKMRIFNHAGEIIYSSDKSEIKLLVDRKAEQCYACHSAEKPLERLTTPERARIFKTGSGQRVLNVISPIYNEPDCYNANCHIHPPQIKVLGVLDIDFSLLAIDQRIRSAEERLLILGLLAAASLSAVAILVTRIVLNRPLSELLQGTRRISQEDLDFKIPVLKDDELAIVAQSFNQMTEELRKAKNSLTQWGCQLEQMVCDRTRDLQEAQQQLIRSEKLASLGKLAAGVAHEINNPLTGILTFSQLLVNQFPPDSEQHQDLKLIVQETIRCRNIVRGLLEFSRQTPPEKNPVNIHEVLNEILYIIGNLESFQNIHIERDYDEEVPPTMMDRDQIKQVLLNIVANAGEAMSSAGGKLKIQTRWVSERSQIYIHFTDNGPGISPEHLHKLFDPFFTTKEMGTGLGLAISYGIVKGHRGDIEVKSEVGKGTEVIVSLPREVQEQPATTTVGLGPPLAQQP